MKIGVYSPNWIGDAVMALPFLQSLRKIEPDAEIIIIGKTWVSDIFIYSRAVDQIITFDDKELKSWSGTWKAGKKIQSLHLDKIYLLTNSLRSAFISWISKTPVRIGYSDQGRNFFLSEAVNKPVIKQHRSKTYHDLLGIVKEKMPLPELLIDDKNVSDDFIDIKKSSHDKWLAIFPGSVAQSRTISFDKWTEILKIPIKEGYGIILFGSKAENYLTGKIASNLPEGSVIDLAGATNLSESIIHISQCYGAIATDSGLGHISAALGIRTISLFGAGDPEETRPRGNRVNYISAGVECSPCRKNSCINVTEPLICISQLDAVNIWKAFTTL